MEIKAKSIPYLLFIIINKKLNLHSFPDQQNTVKKPDSETGQQATG
ncbi:MAG TPA: hypothetical protein P5102_04175 [Candidatus Competibacteraceae bacterium]|nr:hypothetical protein [Candidatus Competibacteraceae bacterium]